MLSNRISLGSSKVSLKYIKLSANIYIDSQFRKNITQRQYIVNVEASES